MSESNSHEFLALAESVNALKFGRFILKSGRESPYFFNSSAFSTGRALEKAGEFLADILMQIQCDCLFGPAYKGISLATAAAIACARRGRDLPVVFDRKESKTHGEGGILLGATEALKIPGRRVVLIDDVISAGTAAGEAVGALRSIAPDAVVVGLVVLLDRQERASEKESISGKQRLERDYGLKVWSVAAFDDLAAYTEQQSASIKADIAEYSARYRV